MTPDNRNTRPVSGVMDGDLRDQIISAASAVPGIIFSFRVRPDGFSSAPFATGAIDDVFGMPIDKVIEGFAGPGKLLFPDDVARTQGSLNESARTLMPWRQEFRIRHPRKGERWVEGSANLSREEGGATLWTGYMQDVTDRKSAEKELHYKNEVLHAQQEASIDGILVVDTDFSISSMNSRFSEMWDLPQDVIDRRDHKEIIALSQPKFVRPDFFAKKLQELYRKKAARSHDELALKDGRIIERHSAPLYSSDGQSCGRLWTFRDITGARKAQQALLESERFARATSDSLSAHIAILDDSGKILATNRSWIRFADENDGDPSAVLEDANYLSVCDDAVGEDQFEAKLFAKGLREVLAGIREEYSLEYPCHSPTEKRWFVGRVTRFAGDGPIRLVIAHENITERVVAISQLRYSKALLSEMEQAAKIGGWEIDLATGIKTWTDQVARMHGVAIGASMTVAEALDFYIGDSRLALVDALQAASTAAKDFDLELEFEATDGVRKWVRVIGHPDIKNGSVFRVVGSFQDITDRKKADIALRESEALFSTIFQASPIAINIFRLADGRSIKVNDGFTALTGFSREEVIGHTAAELNLFHDPEARAGQMVEMLKTAKAEMVDVRLQSKSGDLKDALASLSAVTLNGERAAIVVATDITDRKRAEAEVKALHERLAHAQKMEAIGLLAGGVAHDFNNLLQVINAYSQRIVADYADDPVLLRYGRSIHQAGEIAANLTRQLLVFSRKTPVEVRKVELDRVLSGMENIIRGLVGEKITVQINLKSSRKFIVIDPSQVEQIVLNLVVNARDAMPIGGILSLTTNSWGAAESKSPNSTGSIELTVSDSGHGMDIETQTRVFEPFFTTKQSGRGTGLGLSTVYGIVQQCGGQIEVDSQRGAGTKFTLCFPLIEAPELEEAHIEVAVSQHGSEGILIVEDEEDLRDIYQDVLCGLGYRVVTTENGKKALDVIESMTEKFNLVISDNMMPGMSGIELFQSLQLTHPQLKLLLMSGNAGDRLGHPESIRQVELLTKPFSMKDFAERVRHLLDRVPG